MIKVGRDYKTYINRLQDKVPPIELLMKTKALFTFQKNAYLTNCQSSSLSQNLPRPRTR